MSILSVKFKPQMYIDGCGLAAFEMVYSYLRRVPFRQKRKLLGKLAETDPHANANVRITTDDLVAYAQKRNLEAAWGRVSPDISKMREQLLHFVETLQLPLIVCQQYPLDRTRGHFRVVIGVDGNEIIFHDPDPKSGGDALRHPLQQFLEDWKPTGMNVTGGVALWMSRKKITSPLGPDDPNPWEFSTN